MHGLKKWSSTILTSLLVSGSLLYAQEISEQMYLGRPHFRIETRTACYLYDRAGGGFSSIRDRANVEWVGFKPGEGRVPESAAADFRGLPNLVFRGRDNGSGHPGFDNCISELVSSDRIRTISKSGHWEWTWSFSDEGALLEIIKTDTSRYYWFLYEGTPGGSFCPQKQFWGTSTLGHRTEAPAIGTDQTATGIWNWAYFGHGEGTYCLYILQLTPDHLRDSFSYMGSGPEGIDSADGMVVFGFGREGSEPLMSGPNRFLISFLEQGNSVDRIQVKIEKIYRQYSDQQRQEIGPPRTMH